ncbi:MAG: PAS domain S-box protein, partial [Bacteroidales bacterium]|nr:PAS domain S-box protein [Bacteroidales bacterium]
MDKPISSNELLAEIEKLQQNLSVNGDSDSKVNNNIQPTENNQRLSFLLNNCSEGFWDWNLETNVFFISVQWKAILGFSDNELPNAFTTWLDRMHPDDIHIVKQILKKIIDEKSTQFECYYRLKHRNNYWVSIKLLGESRVDNSGNVNRIMGIHTDISLQISNKRKLEESENRYKKLIDSSPVSILTVDLSGNILSCNAKTLEIHGYQSNKELIHEDISLLIAPTDRSKAKSNREQLIDTGVTDNAEYELLRNGGSTFPAMVSCSLITDIKGKPQSIMVICNDISFQKQVEETLKENQQILSNQNEEYLAVNEELAESIQKLSESNNELQKAEEIFQNIHTGLYIYQLKDLDDDRSLKLVKANPASEKLTGVKAQDIIGKTLDENFPGLRNKGIPQKYAEVVRTETPVRFEEFYYGDDRIMNAAFSFSAFPLPDNHVGVAFNNITDKKIAEEKLIERNKKVEQLNKKLIESNTVLENIIENTDEFILISDEKGFPIRFNAAYAKIVKQALGIDVQPGIKSHEQLEDEFAVEWWEDIHSRVLSGEHFMKEFSLEIDKKLHHFEFYFHPIVQDNKVIGFTEFTRDVTLKKEDAIELENTKSLLESILNESPTGMVVATVKDKQIRYLNQAAVKLLGIINIDNIVGTNIINSTPNWKTYTIDDELVLKEEFPLYKTLYEKTACKNEYKIKRHDGTTKFAIINSVPIHNKDGEMIAAF